MSGYVSHWGVVITPRYILSSKKKKNRIIKYGTGKHFTKEDIRT